MNFIDFALETAHLAGNILANNFRKLEASDTAFKGSRDPVTRVDKESENLIVSRIRDSFPDHAIIAEESYLGEETSNDYKWVIDPLDGTVNYMHGLPIFAVSIALEHMGEKIIGVVHAPQIGETYHAEAGKGAYLNGEKISVSSNQEMNRAVMATGFAYNRNEVKYRNFDNFERISLRCMGMRRMGAASLDLAWVGCGIFDGFWEAYLKPWDIAAGALIVREAGGKVSDFDGGENFWQTGNIVASNGLLHEDLRSLISPFEDAAG